MYLRTTTKKHKGNTYRYVHIVESVWENGRSRQKTVLSLGREDQVDRKRLRQIQALLGKWAGDTPLARLEGLLNRALKPRKAGRKATRQEK